MIDLLLNWLKKAAITLRERKNNAAILIVVALITLLLVVSSAFSSVFRSIIWSTLFMDAVVGLSIIWVGFIIPLIYISVKHDELSTQAAIDIKDRFRHHATKVVIIASLFVTYGIFRNQAKLSADANLNDEVMQVFSVEMNTDTIRCIYHNYGFDDKNICLNKIMKSEEEWSKAIFYVEETWYALQRSQEEFYEGGQITVSL